MHAAALALFRILAPEFSAIENEGVEALTAAMAASIHAPTFGGRAAEALARLAAHELTMQARRSSGSAGVGAVQSERTGDLSVAYAGVESGALDAELGQTSHGLAFLRIRDDRAGAVCGVLT